ncbi:ARHGB factor, partial [Calyptomena viridis]|nr:ARHGB factor [Calyptomena viridis]
PSLGIPVELQDPEVQKHATQILRNMLRQEEAELQRFQELYGRNPDPAVEEQMEGARRRVSQLQLKILQETGCSLVGAFLGIIPILLAPSEPGNILPRSHGSVSPLLPGRLSLDSQDGDSGLESGTERFPSDRTGRPLIIGPEEDCDPGYFNNECDSLFQDLGKLKSRPAHLGVFLRYIFSQADPSPLLFYLCTEVFQQTTAKDSRALGKEIWNIFLDRSAVRAGSGASPPLESPAPLPCRGGC